MANAGLTVRIKADLITELGANSVNVDSSKGVVTLRGSVPYADFLRSAEELARRQGAREVVNELTVDVALAGRPPNSFVAGIPGVTAPEGAPEVPTHMPLAESVREALEDDSRVDAYVLIARVEEGIAYLTGRQETVQASDAATEVAAHVLGILGVSNDIEILPSV
jgi:osmotically-inducible protein OsmY